MRPIRRRSAPVKAPASWPKSSLSSTVSGSAPQLSATKFRALRRLQRCSRRATTSLPVPVSPRTSTSTSASATWRMVSRSRRIAGVVADQRQVVRRLGRGGAQAAVLQHQPALLGGMRDRGGEALAVEGLGDEVVDAVLDRRHRQVDVGMAGDEQHRQLRVDRLDPLEELQPVHPRHADVGDDRPVEVRRRARRAPPRRRRRRAPRSPRASASAPSPGAGRGRRRRRRPASPLMPPSAARG